MIELETIDPIVLVMCGVMWMYEPRLVGFVLVAVGVLRIAT